MMDYTFRGFTYNEYIKKIELFHGSVAPGILLGGFMVEMALKSLPQDGFYDCLCETKTCLPDSVQILTPCSIGNGWIKILDYGKFAMVFYDKYNGVGVRVSIDYQKLKEWPAINEWFFKLKDKHSQDFSLLMESIKNAGEKILCIQKVRMNQLQKKTKGGKIIICPLCSEPYPISHGKVCKACFEGVPYENSEDTKPGEELFLNKTPVEDAVGYHLLNDITKIIPGKKKYAAFKRGQQITADDIIELKSMGKENLYLEEKNLHVEGFVHEDQAAYEFARAMQGEGVKFSDFAQEGKIDLFAANDGLLVINEDILQSFNRQQDVICASIPNFSKCKTDQKIAGTRIIPLMIHKSNFLKAMSALKEPVFTVKMYIKKKIGLLITGNEVYENRISDAFTPILEKKLAEFGALIVKRGIVGDDKDKIASSILEFAAAGIDVIVTTAGMSVDPDDVTRAGIIQAGTRDIIYGVPILPGSMLLYGKINNAVILGMPGCGIYNKISSFDLLLPRVLADIKICRQDVSKMGCGGIIEV
jgi:formylmethanofuran dehydrogenase subunit E